MSVLSDVFEDYLITKNSNQNVPGSNNSRSLATLRKKLPELFLSALENLNLESKNYKIKG